MGWGVLAGLSGSIDGFGGLVWDLHANSGDIFARAACATARLGEFKPIRMAILRTISRCYECADALQGSIYVGFRGASGVGDPVERYWGLPVTGFGWLTTGGVLAQISGGCVWCGSQALVSKGCCSRLCG